MSVGRGPSVSETRLEAVQFLPQSREQLFEFFADAFQLQTITPAWLHFRVLTPPPIAITAGALIDYRLRLHGIPLRWRSCIRVWEPPWRFVDEQVRGPYRRWHHEHVLEEVAGGTRCIDRVDYSVAGGRWVDWLLVRRDVQRIFTYRQQKLAERFGVSRLTQMQHACPGESSQAVIL
jgi:ligand-binding SRPBCC domain-containing protein